MKEKGGAMSETDSPRPVVQDVWQRPPAVVPPSDLNSNADDSGLLGYASSSSERRLMSVNFARWVFGLAIVPTVVGFAILIGYRLTGWEALPGWGLTWLSIGGIATFVLGVIAVVNVVRALSRRPKESTVAFWYGWAIASNFVAVGAAVVCFGLGAEWIEKPHFRMTVTNSTNVPIDTVAVHFQSGDVTVGPILPGQTVRSGLLWPTHLKTPLDITTTAKGQSRRKADRQELNLWTSHSPVRKLDLVIEPAELPKGVR